jgi:hypothetical protein
MNLAFYLPSGAVEIVLPLGTCEEAVLDAMQARLLDVCADREHLRAMLCASVTGAGLSLLSSGIPRCQPEQASHLPVTAGAARGQAPALSEDSGPGRATAGDGCVDPSAMVRPVPGSGNSEREGLGGDFAADVVDQRLRAVKLTVTMAENSPAVMGGAAACRSSAHKRASWVSFSAPMLLSVVVPWSLTWVVLMIQPAAPSLLMAALISSCVGVANMLCMLLAVRLLRKAKPQPEGAES